MFRPEEISAAVPPADFDAFWDATLANLAKIPLDMTLEEQKDKETADGRVYKVKYRSWGGRWAWAWLSVPKADGKFPAKVVCPPVSVYQPGEAPRGGGELRIAVAVHGGDLKDYPAKSDFDYMNTGITSRETYMLRYSYCCLVRCFDIIKKHAKCNGEISIEGGSQGAGLSLVLAGLRNAQQARGIAVALCRIDWTVLGYTEWGPGCPEGEDPKKIAEVVRYFDPACFAHRIRTPVRLAIGLFDFCAPAEGIFTAINALPKDTPCQVFIDPYGGHFTLDAADFNQGVGMLEVPRWQGSDADNKLRNVQ
ncbi:MAG: acetylxylan esterase [Armatimonadota bacterium]